MKPLAAFIMRGPAAAALVTGATGLASLLVPFIGLLSSAALALVTLRRGARAGVVVAAIAGAGCLVGSVLFFGTPWPALVAALILWVPVWLLALALRFSRSLALAAQLAGAAAVLLLLGVYALAGDPAAWWSGFLAPLRAALIKEGGLDAATADAAFVQLAQWMTGTFAAGLLLQVLLGLFIGRAWQATLYNPGGFAADFQSFRLHPVFGLIGLTLVVLIGFWPGPGMVTDLLIVFSPLWLLQGLAVIHGLFAVRRVPRGWLVALYVLLVVFIPQTLVLVACLGLVDIWADLRARLGQRPPA
jgi:hypothetical protein